MSLLRHTLAALLTPRRLIPIALVSAPLIAAQHSYSRDPGALPLGLAMCVLFALLAPFLWRTLAGRGTGGLLAYGLAGAAVVGLLGLVVPRVLGVGPTFITARESLLVSLALFWVGGWGLGRDIELEVSLARANARADDLAREAERAQLLALRSHLDPHFLFNTLNAIAEWCRTDGETAERAVLRLSGMLRTILEGVRLGAWPLRRELDLCRDLFALYAVRDPGRFDCRVDGEPGDATVPPLLLLPLAENAIKHGPAAGHEGPVRVAVRRVGDFVEVTVDNPGPFTGPRPGGDGLTMVERRIALAYDGAATLEIGSAPHGTRAIVRLPAGRAPTHLT